MSRTKITWRRKAMGLTAGIAVAALALTACSGGSSGTKTTGPAAAVSQADIDKAMKTPTKLTFWTWVPDIENEVKLFEAAYPAITVDVVNVGQGADHYKKMRSALQAGKGAPDVAQIEFQHVQSFALGDNLLDLTPYIPASTSADYVPWVWKQVLSTDGKKIWSIPQDSGPMGGLYRDDILKAHNIAVPKTWDEFATAAGVDKLYSRLTRDARSACRELGGGNELWWQKAHRACQAGLIDKVVTEIGKPGLLARHEKTSYFRLARRIEGEQKVQQTAQRAGN